MTKIIKILRNTYVDKLEVKLDSFKYLNKETMK